MANVLIDGYNLALAKGTGIATYARNLCKEVSALGHDVSVLYGESIADDDDALLREIAFFDPLEKKAGKLRQIARGVGQGAIKPFSHFPSRLQLTSSVVRDSASSRLPVCEAIYNGEDLFHRSNVAFNLGKGFSNIHLPGPVDLAHWTYPLPVTAKSAANIYTLHDLVPLRLPYTTLDNKRNYLRLVKQIAKRADHIVTVSECSKRDIVELLGVSEARITNTYQSVQLPESAWTFDDTEIASIIEGGFGLGFREYFLFWGSIEPKKNIHRLVEGYLASGVKSPLVIVGAQSWKADEELRLVKEGAAAADGQIIQLSFVPQNTLIQLIRGAKAALFPSLYEGFGLPALEAMLLGTPVIGSNTGSLPEVIGEAGLLVDPYDTKDIAKAMRKIDADEDLRRELVSRGSTQAELFSPTAYRSRLENLYQQLF